LAVFEWITSYNNERLHHSLDYRSPREYEEFWRTQQVA
jgi:transposase InsO family protein